MTNNSREEFRFWDVWNEHMTYSRKAKNLAEFFGWYERSRENNVILMYSTGLTDINGKLIFEGDILRHPDDSKFEVIFELPDAQFRAKYENDPYTTSCIFLQIDTKGLATIIGNIYEDKNLIKDCTIS